MAVLREQEAIAYLDRARSTINPEVHFFSHLPLVDKMLEIESAFLQKLQSEPEVQRMAEVAIGPHGFPELQSWQVDINQAFKIMDRVRQSRAKSLTPWLQQLKMGSPEGIMQTSEKVAATFDTERSLAKALEGLTPDQMRLLKTNQDFPFSVGRETGILVVYDKAAEDFQKEAEEAKKAGKKASPRYENAVFYNSPIYAGLKYIDAVPGETAQQQDQKKPARVPALIYTVLTKQPSGALGVTGPSHILTPKIPLNEYCEADPGYGYNLQWKIERSDTRRKEVMGKDGRWSFKNVRLNSAPDEYETLDALDRLVASSHPSVLQAFLSVDTSEMTTKQVDALIDVIPEFSTLVHDIVEFSGRAVSAAGISTDEFKEKNLDFASRMTTIYNAVDHEAVKQALQGAMAEGVHKVEKQALAVAETKPAKRDYDTAVVYLGEGELARVQVPSGIRRFFSSLKPGR